MCMLIMVIFNTKFRCTLIAMNLQTKICVSVLYAKYSDYGTFILSKRGTYNCIVFRIKLLNFTENVHCYSDDQRS